MVSIKTQSEGTPYAENYYYPNEVQSGIPHRVRSNN